MAAISDDSRFVLPPPGDAPTGVVFPIGLVQFRVTGVPVGGTVEMSIDVPASISLTSYYKRNQHGVWVDVAKQISNNGNKTRLTFDLTDGGEFDGDQSANGVLQDPGGPALRRHVIPAAIPTLNLWGLMLLSGLLGMVLLWQGRRRLT